MAQKTSLAAAITTAGQSSITVADFLGFPASGEYTILIDAEQLRVTAGNGTTTWTVSRGYGGTTAVTHLISATITQVDEAYAELGDLVATLALGTATDRYGLLSDLLADVSRDLDAATMRRFFRDPQVTGTTTVYADVVNSGCASLRDAIGRPRFADGRPLDLVSITTLEVRDSEGSSYATIAAGDTGYYLDGWTAGMGVYGTDWPYEDVTLSPQSSLAVFPVGKRAVKVTGAFGFPSVPPSIKRAVLAETAERFRQRISGEAQPEGVNQFGMPIFRTGTSPDMRRVLADPFSLRPVVG